MLSSVASLFFLCLQVLRGRIMPTRILRNIPLIIVAVAAIACATSGAEPQSAANATQTPPPVVGDSGAEVPTSTLPSAAEAPINQGTPLAGTRPPTATTAPQPTEAPLMSVWPLEADLFYLNNAGQVWRQPLLGDETAAAAVTQLDQVVRDFAVAPGGEWLLYRTDEFVAVTSVSGLSGQLISSTGPMAPADSQGRTMAWSPDASKLAYVNPAGFEVYIPGAGPDFGPLIFPIVEELIRELAWSPDAGWLLVWREDNTAALYESAPDVSLWVELGAINDFAWLKDGRLAFAPVEGGLALLDPADLESRTFMVPQERQVSLIAQRPDGTLAFFVHTGGADTLANLHLGDPLDESFRQESGVAIDTQNMQWNPVATRLLTVDTSDSTGRTLIILDPATGSSATFGTSGQPVAFDWGNPPPTGVAGMALPNDLYFVAPEAGILQVWRLPKGGGAPLVLTEATQDVIDYHISPDGTQITYTSGGVIYRRVIGTLDITEVATLATTGPVRATNGTPAFSPSGRQIAYANQGIWVLDLDTGESRRLIADNLPTQADREREIVVYSSPQWSPDGQWLLVRAGYYEGSDFALLSASGLSSAQPAYLNLFVAEAAWAAPDMALVFSGGGAYSEPGLRIVRPGTPPAITEILDQAVLDAELRADGRIAYLRAPGVYGLGPTSIQLASILPTGGSPTDESSSFVLELPELSPDGSMIAGLVQARINEFGTFSGRLAVANPGNGELFAIEGVSSVRDLQWGR